MIIGRRRRSSKLHTGELRLAHVYGGIRWGVSHRLWGHMLIMIIYGSSILRILASLLLLVLLVILLRLVTVRVWEIEGGRRH